MAVLKQASSRLALLFVLFYPSLIFYSSLALRDTLLLTFIVLATVFFIEENGSLQASNDLFVFVASERRFVIFILLSVHNVKAH